MEKTRLPAEERHRIEAEILHSLWQEGASNTHVLITRLGIIRPVLEECLDELIGKEWVYRHWESPDDERATVFYLTERARRVFRAALAGNPRYRMKTLWDALKREEAGLPQPVIHPT